MTRHYILIWEYVNVFLPATHKAES
jgi:hypothetical protein